MKPHHLLIALTMVGAAPAEESDLPQESKELLAKLEKWEEAEALKLKIAIEEKRKTVRKLLEEQVETATKEGDLDGALAIRSAIKKVEVTDTPQLGWNAQGVWDWWEGESFLVIFGKIACYINGADIRWFDLRLGNGTLELVPRDKSASSFTIKRKSDGVMSVKSPTKAWEIRRLAPK